MLLNIIDDFKWHDFYYFIHIIKTYMMIRKAFKVLLQLYNYILTRYLLISID